MVIEAAIAAVIGADAADEAALIGAVGAMAGAATADGVAMGAGNNLERQSTSVSPLLSL